MKYKDVRKLARFYSQADEHALDDDTFNLLFNMVLQNTLIEILQVDNTWKFDDASFGDKPVGFLDLMSGQTTKNIYKEENGAELLEIEGIWLSNNGNWVKLENLKELPPEKKSGTPTGYKLYGRTLEFSSIPIQDKPKGLKIAFRRNLKPFLVTDLDREIPFPNNFSKYLAVSVSVEYASGRVRGNVKVLSEVKREEKGKVRTFMSERNKTDDDSFVWTDLNGFGL